MYPFLKGCWKPEDVIKKEEQSYFRNVEKVLKPDTLKPQFVWVWEKLEKMTKLRGACTFTRRKGQVLKS